jgi:hypothetical protein
MGGALVGAAPDGAVKAPAARTALAIRETNMERLLTSRFADCFKPPLLDECFDPEIPGEAPLSVQ